MILVFSGLLSTLTPELVEIKYICQEPYVLMEVYNEEKREFELKCISYVDMIDPIKVEIR